MTNKKSNKRAARGPVRQNKSAKKSKMINLSVKASNTPFGSYNVQTGASFKTSVPSAYGQVDSIAGPQKSYDSQGNIRIKHREFIKDLFSTNPDYTQLFEFIANPTVASCFPWLSGMSTNFQKFCFEKLCLHYVTQSPTTSPGSMMIIPIYDVDQDVPVDKSQALTFQDTVRSPAWQECCALLPKNRLCGYKDYFTKMKLDDLKLSVPAKVVVASSGNSDSSPSSGELWVEYDIKMSCPQRALETFSLFDIAPGKATLFYGNPKSEFLIYDNNLDVSLEEPDLPAQAEYACNITLPTGNYVCNYQGNYVTGGSSTSIPEFYDTTNAGGITNFTEIHSNSTAQTQGWAKCAFSVQGKTGTIGLYTGGGVDEVTSQRWFSSLQIIATSSLNVIS